MIKAIVTKKWKPSSTVHPPMPTSTASAISAGTCSHRISRIARWRPRQTSSGRERPWGRVPRTRLSNRNATSNSLLAMATSSPAEPTLRCVARSRAVFCSFPTQMYPAFVDGPAPNGRLAHTVKSQLHFPWRRARSGNVILKTALVRKFRSIENSETVRFEPDVTCLVGKNESGKTAFLEALSQANPLAGSGRGFDELRDYPRRLRGRDRGQIAATTPISATFERDYAGRQRLLVADQEVAGELAALLGARLPRLLYFDGYSVLPGRVSIPRLQATATDALQPGERTALALLRLAGVAADDFAESEYEVRKAALESAATTVSEEVFRYWSQNPELTVELDLDFREAGHNGQGGPPFLDVRIRNHRHRVTTNFGERSGGFVWFFSFVAAFSELRDSEGLVLLLDEPGLGLHAAGQADLLRYLDEQLAGGHQSSTPPTRRSWSTPTGPTGSARSRTSRARGRGSATAPGDQPRHRPAPVRGAGRLAAGGPRGGAAHPARRRRLRPRLPGGHERLPARRRPPRPRPGLAGAAHRRARRPARAGRPAGRPPGSGRAAGGRRRPPKHPGPCRAGGVAVRVVARPVRAYLLELGESR